jgi:hypothetical protein
VRRYYVCDRTFASRTTSCAWLEFRTSYDVQACIAARLEHLTVHIVSAAVPVRVSSCSERRALKKRLAMHLVELLLPLHDNGGQAFEAEKYAEVRQDLTQRFGGLTAFTRSPAQGTTTESGRPVHDEIVVFEVMTEKLDLPWWRSYRLRLEREFRQDQILIRASTVTLL